MSWKMGVVVVLVSFLVGLAISYVTALSGDQMFRTAQAESDSLRARCAELEARLDECRRPRAAEVRHQVARPVARCEACEVRPSFWRRSASWLLPAAVGVAGVVIGHNLGRHGGDAVAIATASATSGHAHGKHQQHRQKHKQHGKRGHR